MKLFIDTNVFISVIEKSKGSDAGREVLNGNGWEIGTSVLNLVEVRNVLMKKKHKSAEYANEVIDWLVDVLDYIIQDAPDMCEIDSIHKDKLLDPMDCIFYCISNDMGADLVTIERELKDHGAVDPRDLV